MKFRLTPPELLVLVAAFIWGFAFYFQKTAMQDVGPFTFTGLRTAIAAVCLAPFAWREHVTSSTSLRPILPAVMLGAFAFLLAGVLQQQGLVTATVTNTSFLTALYVVVTPFLFWFFRNEKPSRQIWISVALAFVGTWALGGGSISALSKGDWWVVASVFFWSLYMVATSLSAKAARPLAHTCLAFAGVAIIALPIAFFVEGVSPTSLKAALPELLTVGIVSSAVTFGLLAVALRHISGNRATILLSTETLFAAVAGYVLLGERLGWINWIGAALLFAAVIVVQVKPGEQPKS